MCAVALASAGPVEFGLAEYNAALAARGLKWKAKTELSLDPPETYRIEPFRAGGATIFGGDLRGLMYGLLEAAEQVRSTGRLTQAHGVPDTAMRAIRVFLHPTDLEKYPEAFWRSYFEVLARDRFNRFTLVLTDPTPYPFLFPVEGASAIRVPGLTADQRERNLRRLRFLSQTANDYAIDFALGIWESSGQSALRPTVEGLTRANTGLYTYNALRKLLAVCPMIRGVQMQASSERVGFYRDFVFKALHEAGRRVTLDPRGALARPTLLKAAQEAGVALVHRAPDAWPSGFEIDPPLAPGHWDFERHQLFYWLWGRLGYDPKTKPPKSESPEEYRAASQTIHLLVAAHHSDPNMYTWPAANPGCLDDYKTAPGDWGSVASIPEAVHNRLEHVASAKQTPIETAELLIASADGLDKASRGDLQILARLARYHAHKQRAAYQLELFNQTKDSASLDRAEQELKGAQSVWTSLQAVMGEAENGELLDVRLGLDLVAQHHKEQNAAAAVEIPLLPKPLPRPQFTHMPVKTSLPDQPVTLTLQIASPKDVRAVRLHYRTTNPAAHGQTEEKAAAASLSFTIPAADVSSNWEVLYYFEVLNRENGGWFEPDPLAAAPYYVVSVVAPPPPQ